MRVLLDTNVLVSAFTCQGHSAELLTHCLRNHEIVISDFILDEVEATLLSKFGIPEILVARAVTFLRRVSEVMETGMIDVSVCRDPDDNAVLVAAREGSVDCLITGDSDLLVLSSFSGVPILKPADFWRFETGFQPGA